MGVERHTISLLSPAKYRNHSVIAGVIVSAGLHIGIVAIVIVASYIASLRQVDDEQGEILKFESVELVALGQPRPDNALPRIANPEPAAPQQVIETEPPPPKVETQPPKPEPEPEPVVNPEPRPQRSSPPKDDAAQKKRQEEQRKIDEQRERRAQRQAALEALNNPNRPANTDTPEGHEDGVVGGSISDAAMQHLLGTYVAKLLREIAAAWQIPGTISRAEVAELAGEVWVSVELSSSGQITNYIFRDRSSNEHFNASVENVLKRFHVRFGARDLPLPENPEVRRAVLQRGLELRDWEDLSTR